jgi:hypothetical protein
MRLCVSKWACFVFNYSNYNYTNTNAGLSPHLCLGIIVQYVDANLANSAKNKD